MKVLTNSTLVGLFLILSGISMELFGLFTQYYLGFEPCANCVQIRIAILFIVFAGVLHIFSNGSYTLKIVTLLLSFLPTYFSLHLSWENHLIETGQKLSTCGFGTPFPSFIPLDKWLPAIFEAKGPCGTPSQLFGNFTFTDLSVFGLSIVLILIFIMLITNIFNKGKTYYETK